MLIGLVTAFVLVDAVLAAIVFGQGGAPKPTVTQDLALPLHPVAGTFVPDDTQFAQCGDERCFQQALGNVAYREGPGAAFALVDDVYGSGASPACHRAAHAIGAATLARYDGNVAETLAKGASTCGSGYYHGVLERSLVAVTSRTPAALARVARRLCTGAKSMTPWIAYQCLHGLGHGLMIGTGLQLPTSLTVCKRLSTWWDRDACRSGVFMENLSSSYGVVSRWLRDDDPVYPCNAVEREAKRRCYQMVTSRILPTVGNDWEKTAEVCAGVEHDFVFMCFRSLGRDASAWSDRDPDETAERCGVARPYGREAECVFGASQEIAANFTSGRRAAELCDVVDLGLRDECYTGIGSVVGRLRKTERAREADCRGLTGVAAYVEACLAGGRNSLPRR
jgi:hypothetical protein